MERERVKSYDLLGNIALVRFPKEFKRRGKKNFSKKIIKQNKSVKTVLERKGKIKGRLRKFKTKHVMGEKTKEVLYRENNCVFRFNIDESYFSSRLSNERKEISQKVKRGDIVIVLFAGVGAFPIVIAKNSNTKKIYSNEINRAANKYAKLNIELNKLKEKIELVPGDIKKIAKKLKREGKKFDVIVMPRPNLKDTFLREAFSLSKKGTRIYYYDFCMVEDKEKVVEKIRQEAKRNNKRIKILNFKEAGEIAPYKVRMRVDMEVL